MGAVFHIFFMLMLSIVNTKLQEEEAPASDWSRRRQQPSHGLSVNYSSSALSHQVSDVQAEKSWPISTDDDDEWRVVDESCPDKGVCGIRERTHGPRYDNQGKHAGMRQMLQHGGALNDAQQWKNACAAAMRQGIHLCMCISISVCISVWMCFTNTL